MNANVKTFRVVDISWRKRVSLDYDEELGKYELIKINPFAASSSGFYAIYGRHPVYGPDVLLYIGQTKTKEESKRSFLSRLTEHAGEGKRFWYFQDLSFSFGTVDQKLNREDIEAVESVLIACNKPAMNIQQIYTAKDSARDILVRNWEFPGALAAECSGEYWNQ